MLIIGTGRKKQELSKETVIYLRKNKINFEVFSSVSFLLKKIRLVIILVTVLCRKVLVADNIALALNVSDYKLNVGVLTVPLNVLCRKVKMADLKWHSPSRCYIIPLFLQ